MRSIKWLLFLGSLASCTPSRATSNDVDHLVQRSEAANQALVRGDVDRYAELVTLASDFTLMSPFGGTPSRGNSPEAIERMRKFFRDGELRQEVVATYHSDDMIVLAVIEHARHLVVGSLPSQDWSLRVTLVYRRSSDGWELVHRHADPLVHGVSHAQSAALARGEGGAR